MSQLAVHVKKVINAPVEEVFEAWTDPEQMKQWYSPEGMTTPNANSDNRQGGAYMVSMKMGDKQFDMSGKYLEFDRPNKLAFTWNDDASIVTVTFTEVDEDKTEVTLGHTGFPNEVSRTQHNEGWVGTLNKLEKHLG